MVNLRRNRFYNKYNINFTSDFWDIVMELDNISSDNIFITSNRHDDNIYYYNDNYIQ